MELSTENLETLNISLEQFEGTQFATRMQSFQYYKISAVKYEIFPGMNVSAYPNTEDSAGGETIFKTEAPSVPLSILWESNADATYTDDKAGVQRIMFNPRTKNFNPHRKITMYRKVKPTVNLATGAATTMRLPWSPLISTHDRKSVFGRVIIACNNMGYADKLPAYVHPFTYFGTVKTTYYVSLYRFQNETE